MRFVATALVFLSLVTTNARADDAAGVEFFEAKVRPILVEHCLKCHGETKQRGGLRLDTKAAWMKGGDSGTLLVVGKSDRSMLIRMLKGTSENPPQMPPDSRLSDEQVAALAKWIDMGAPDPRTGTALAAAKGIDWKAAEKFWAFRPVTVSVPPVVEGQKSTNPIDRFIAAKWQEKGLTPVGRAEKIALIRRATFDLIGLPPTRVDVEAFLADSSPDAFAKVVNRLLASPHYGEHQARQWLDVARFGEEQNFYPTKENNSQAWRYRDWTIDAFNSDLSYDRFIKYQIAADLFDESERDPKHLAALGLFGLGPIYVSNGDPGRAKAEQLDDRIDTLTRGFLGLTVSCARCHDHKFDPIPTIDYYSIAGIFDSTKMADVPLAPKAKVEDYETARRDAVAADERVKEFLQAEKDRVARQYADALPDTIVAIWKHHAKKLDQPEAPAAADAQAVKLDAESFGRMMRYLGRFNVPNPALKDWSKLLPKKDGPREPPAEIRAMAEAFCQVVKKNLDLPYAKRNLDIQNDLFSKKGVFPISYDEVLLGMSPQMRVACSQLKAEARSRWDTMPAALPQSHGIAEGVKMTDMKVSLRGNPYKLGEVAPRRFLRVIAGEERTPFKEGSGRRQLAEAIADPKNPLTARVLVNRIWQQHFGKGLVGTPSNFGQLGERPSHPELLDYLAERFIAGGWSIKQLHREILLSDAYQRASDSTPKNQEIDPENRLLWKMSRRRLTVEAYRDAMLAAAGQLDPAMGGPSFKIDDVTSVRRTVYGKISRLDLSQLLRLFDFPDANITSDRRTETTVPQQMLFALNSPFAIAQAKALALRLKKDDPAETVRDAYWFAFSRPATDAEVMIGIRFLTTADAPNAKNALTRVERFTQALLASNEFVYVD